MKKYILFLFLFLLMVSCANEETLVLNEKIKTLETENQKLKDSISKKIEDDLLSMQLVGLPVKHIFKKNEEIEIDFIFHRIGEIGDYQVVDVFDESNRKVIIPNAKETKFTYKFTSTSLGEQDIRLNAEFQLKDGRKVVFPGYVVVKVEE
ncbi:MAG TPA: hypothetical protein VLZ72_10790 [Flavobacterium sp.]|nr:hypothetical protein [Flavobacterium sp.]